MSAASAARVAPVPSVAGEGSRAVTWRTRLALRRDRALVCVQVGLGVLVVAGAVLAVVAWRDHAPALALALGGLPAPVVTMMYVTGPMVRDEASGATRVVLAAAVPRRVVADATARAVALGWVVAGGVGAAVAVSGANAAGADLVLLGATAVILGPIFAWVIARLTIASALARGTETGLVAIWIGMVLVILAVVLVTTGLVSIGWPLLASGAVATACAALGSWGQDGGADQPHQ